jgi:hypothetical protein
MSPKEELQSKITSAVQDFQSKTGMCVRHIHIEYFETYEALEKSEIQKILTMDIVAR